MRLPERSATPEVAGLLESSEVVATAHTIAAVQERSGAIPWFTGGHVDCWDHVECAMALSAAGMPEAAERAYAWLRRTQRPDGSWPMRTRGEAVEDTSAEANHCAYVAVGVWHHLLVTGDEEFAAWMWPTVRCAVDFVLGLQTARGEIVWARDGSGAAATHALLAGCSSIHQSLRYAIALADRQGEPQPDWELAAGQLGHVVTAHPEAFADRQRYSMDWYYPVLAGPVRGRSARRRLAARWEEFVVPGLGARCVADRPWVTGAETCELALTLDALGERARAIALLRDMQHLREDDGSYWTGYVFEDDAIWPEEKSTWTAAAVILAADALSDTSGGAGIFRLAGLGAAGTPEPTDPLACGCEPALADADDPDGRALLWP
ncbi:MAG: prenyltransferase [Streptosporangiales bacterium]|nr:prenyltransferase [Streptosporangiales bacterium]